MSIRLIAIAYILLNTPMAEAVDLKPLLKNCQEAWAKIGTSKDPSRQALVDTVKPSANTMEQLDRFASVEDILKWGKTTDDELDYLRLVRLKDYLDAPTYMAGVEIYGEETYTAWREADDYLRSIPIGKFEPTLDVLSKNHVLATSALSKTLKRLDFMIPDGYLADKGGVLKHRASINIIPILDPVMHPFNDEQYAAIKSNQWLQGFIELPFHEPGKHYGYIEYSEPRDTKPELDALLKWYDLSKNKLDPVELAARFSFRYTSIHPFIDGNGRSSRLIMDRILAEYGLPPPILKDSWEDIVIGEDKFVQEVREGIDRYLTIAETKAKQFYSEKNGNLVDIPAVRLPMRGTYILAPLDKQTFKVEGKELYFSSSDGFFYDHFGVPYVVHENRFYPVSDRSYRLYEMNHAGTSPTKEPGLSKGHALQLKENITFIKTVADKTVELDKFTVEPYASIAEANKVGDFQFYPWQKELFENAVTIKDTDPTKVLSAFRFDKTTFSKGSKPETILAQYEFVDFLYWQMQQAAKKFFPDLETTVLESRRKLHQAARDLLEPYREARNALPSESQLRVNNNYRVKLFDAYLENSKLSYKNFDRAMEVLPDDSMVVMRSDMPIVSKIGFSSISDFRKIFTSLPNSKAVGAFLEKLKNFMTGEGKRPLSEVIAAIHEKIEKNEGPFKFLPPALEKMYFSIEKTYNDGGFNSLLVALDKVLESPYMNRGLGSEWERAFVIQQLHAGDVGNKSLKSFTTSTQLMSDIPFVDIPANGQISFVRIPKSKVKPQLGSDVFKNEYEILATDMIGPQRIIQKFSGADLARPIVPVANLPDEDPAKSFLQNYLSDY